MHREELVEQSQHIGLELSRAVVFVQAQRVNEVVLHSRHFCLGGSRCAYLDVPIDLPGVSIDDGARIPLGKRHGVLGLADSRGAEDNDEFSILRH